jgi:hypothetical protein
LKGELGLHWFCGAKEREEILNQNMKNGTQKRIIGVMGPGAQQATDNDLSVAYEIGRVVAGVDAILLCGACLE